MTDDLMRIANAKNVIAWTRCLHAAREYKVARNQIPFATKRGMNAVEEAQRGRNRAIAAEFESLLADRGRYVTMAEGRIRYIDPGETVKDTLLAAHDAIEQEANE